jgi:hypothetical protein
LIKSPWDTPWEILMVARDGLAGFEDAEDSRLVKRLSFADATDEALGSRGADSSAWRCVLTPAEFDFTSMGAGSDFFGAGSELAITVLEVEAGTAEAGWASSLVKASGSEEAAGGGAELG